MRQKRVLSKANIYRFFIGCIFALSFVITIHAQDYLPDKPTKETAVYDAANLLSASERTSIEQKLINYADSTSTQIVVATIRSLEGRHINLYAAQWAHKWGIGQAEEDNGVLFLIAQDERKMAIQVGYGLEHLLTDAMSRRIIELIIAPHFKQNDYFSGIDAGTTSMMEVLAGEYKNEDSQDEGSAFPFIIFLIIIILIIIILTKAKKNGGRGYRSGSGPIILTGTGRTGGFGSGGFGSGGGGFGSGGFGGGFGGGGFGGGGASGGW